MSPNKQEGEPGVFGSLDADNVNPEVEELEKQLEAEKKESRDQREKTQYVRAETNRWIVGIIVAVTALLMFTAGRMTSQWFDLNKELRELRERIVVIETMISPELP